MPITESVIICGDAITSLKTIEDQSIQCVVTSPPYWGLRDYNITGQIGQEDEFAEYINNLREVFFEINRILKNDGTLWLNIGDGFTSGNRKYRAADKKNPARAMKNRPDTPKGLKRKDLLGLPWHLAFALQKDGWYLRSDIIWHKRNAMPESVKDRPYRNHEYLFLFSKSHDYYFDQSGLVDRDKNKLRSVWEIKYGIQKFKHGAIFPVELVEPCIQASSKVGDYILDPFFGTGTVGEACENLGRNYIGIEIKPEFVNIASKRLKYNKYIQNGIEENKKKRTAKGKMLIDVTL